MFSYVGQLDHMRKRKFPLSSFIPLFLFAQEGMSRIELKPSMLPLCDLHVPFQVTGLCEALSAVRIVQGLVDCYCFWHYSRELGKSLGTSISAYG